MVIEDVHHLHKPEQIQLIDKASEAISLLNKAGMDVVLITNQSVVAKQLCTEQELNLIHKKLLELLENNNAKLNKIYYCPHHPEGFGVYKKNCDCRKPNPGMLFKAADEMSIDLKNSYLVGDKTSDIKAGKIVGCKTIGVRTGYGCNDAQFEILADVMADDLYEAAKIILGEKNDN